MTRNAAPQARQQAPGRVHADRTPGGHSPSDRGGEVPGLGHADSMYDLLGSSYTLNDHSLAGEDRATLIPLAGGKMPFIVTPTKTWVLGSYPIYNYQEDGDRGNRWYSENSVEATCCTRTCTWA